MTTERILILDFGSQYTQLIARRVREARVYCEIHPYKMSLKDIKAMKPAGIILSGSPASVFDKKAPLISKELFKLNIPILGICYGMQHTSKLFGGKVERSDTREYGPATIKITKGEPLFKGINAAKAVKVWMSHGDRVESLPKGFKVIARTGSKVIGAVKSSAHNFHGVQFHPEVAHTPQGAKLIKNFLTKICKIKPSWTMK
ncbi:MAG: glutamine-hydrolyzing GMP synthase, partial [Deltaproteobacteria bacterium]|nr:glutamine-hydrolyzing GMP synthase [Deltaproteobacteria bacterium]